MRSKLLALFRWSLLAGLLFLAFLTINAALYHAWQTAAPPGYENSGHHARVAVYRLGDGIGLCFLAAVAFLNIRSGWPYVRSKFTVALVVGLTVAFIVPRLGYYVVENQCRSSGESSSSEMESCSSLVEEVNESCGNPPCKAVEAASGIFRPAPYFVNGELVGYRLYPGSDEHAFDSLGLEFGTLVTEIDGQDLQDPAGAMHLFLRISSGEKVQVRIEKDGQSELIDVQAK